MLEGAKILTPETSDEIGVLSFGQPYAAMNTVYVGVVTSGIPLAPTVGKNIAMGYIKSGFHKKGTAVMVEVRRKARPALVTPMPFITTRYWRG